VTRAERALDGNGRLLALRVDTIANLGAYLSNFATSVPTYLYATLLAGQYKTPAIHCNVRSVFTNTAPVDAYRGAGRPEATYVVERMVERAARDMKMDPAEIRRRNLVQPDEFPYQTPVALTYDSGQYEKALDEALKMIDYRNFGQRRQESERNGKLRGLGFSAYIEACGIAPSQVVGSLGAGVGLWESAQVRFNATGSVSVFTGSHSHGQGHETTFAQVVAEMLGCDESAVDIVHGDTARVPFGMGTYGSRSIAVGGSAIHRSVEKIIDKGKKIAAHLLEASESDISFENGQFTVSGTDRAVDWGTVALTAYVPHNFPHETLEPGLEETSFYDPKNFTFPAGTYICEVEVDPETGAIEIDRFVAADDFGNVVNPMIVEGQVHGGLAQGLGQAMLENCVYDEDGQLVTASYMDYAMPRADDVPTFQVHRNEVPCTTNPLGVKGCGEAGAIGAPPAIINAVLDALRPLGVEDIEMPATPGRVWEAIDAARRSHDRLAG
jgi:carbon-monoxide dehydrogenase large subunit